MQLLKPTATLFLDTRKKKENGKYPLKMTIYLRPDKKRYSTGIDLTEDEWKKVNGKRLKDENLKDTRISIKAVLSKAEKILDNLMPFSFTAFERTYFQNGKSKTDLSIDFWFNQYMLELEMQDRVGTKSSYNTTLNSLKGFKSTIQLTDITKDFLEKYELHMKQTKKSPSTIGIYLRQLRAIINRAIAQDVIGQDCYPFKSYKIPGSRNVKKALNDVELQLLLNFRPKLEEQQWALDFWIFSYLCNGMNFTDIAHLTRDNIDGNFMHFIREKTKRTRKKDLRAIKVVIHQRAREIITKWGNTNPEEPYVFSILSKELSAKTQRNRIQRFIKTVNKRMIGIGKDIGIKQKIRGYEARHTFSTRLMRMGASTQLIKESLGHSNSATTELYMGDFAESVKTEYSDMLTTF